MNCSDFRRLKPNGQRGKSKGAALRRGVVISAVQLFGQLEKRFGQFLGTPIGADAGDR